MSTDWQPPGEHRQTSEPGLTPPSALLAAAEAVINRVLALDPEGAARLVSIQGQVLRVELLGIGMHLFVVPEATALRLFGDYAAEPDCILRATPAALLGMALAQHREDEVFSGAVQIDGDNGLAQTIGEVFKGLDIDWEEQLAALVGDNIAHQLGNQVRAGSRWAERSGRTLQTDLREYLIEEGRFLPSQTEMQGFLDGVDQLRDDVERLEARVERLARQRSQSTGTDLT
ncbi:SCP2 sterol-binding domain-containing protein [Lamprobacter modestohalophilus]|uniref:ubiquinone biosynthesis accessory factor UbiJ n=1 Tax=Lamprobacter modestohalophilus TaxID=1064514 RepID=UPI002ADEE3EE|nr:SCP2 sterol-binding domain-containing protein [Lamprobacter modestohalophilus]MEA1049357.1 SCP2 sterol-binding domain-containing protein [Lamprobacter modestohalophilus]